MRQEVVAAAAAAWCRLPVKPRLRLLLAFAAIATFASACAPVGYLAQSVTGHLQLVAAARPVSDWLDDPATSPALRARLQLSQQIRDFAVKELHLPDNASYRRYADLGRSAAVWNVVAAPELGLSLKTWCYPVVGCVSYRGFYDRAAAESAAAPLREAGLDVYVYAVPAYSTLGKLPGSYFADPLLNTFVNYPEADLARLIFHELTHQVVYLPGQTVFNESFASSVERLGGELWLTQHGTPAARVESERSQGRREDFRKLTLQTRAELVVVYDQKTDDVAKRLARDKVMATMRERYRVLKRERWDGYSGYDPWIANANNASLGLVAAYNSLVPDFQRLFEKNGNDFEKFYADVRRIAELPDAQRKAALSGQAF